MIPRLLETEAMDSLAEAEDYDSMDHAEVNRAFVADLLMAGLPDGEMLDLGTGTAQIPIELCRHRRRARVLAVDAAENMLKLGRQNVSRAGLDDCIQLQQADAKRLPFRDRHFAGVMSNSIIHHIPQPSRVLDEVWRVTAPGGLIFFRDLLRPGHEATIRRLVETYAAGAKEHQQQMLADSLRAALTVAEMRKLVAAYGQPDESVRATSDRHWTWVATRV